MRIFWIIVGLLLVGGVAVLWDGGGTDEGMQGGGLVMADAASRAARGPATPPSVPDPQPEPAGQSVPPPATTDDAPDDDERLAADPPPDGAALSGTTVDATTPAGDPEPAPDIVAAGAPDGPTAQSPPDETTEEQLVADLLASAEERREGAPDETTPSTSPPVDPAVAADPATDAESDSTTEAGDETSIELQEDGSRLIDGRFTLRGAGSADDPYRISWEHLVSASESYRPREGQTEIPAWVQLLHDKHVKITGYLAFPLASQTVDEALIMLNQWDGCCIGVPPSPYDGVEVRLEEPYELKPGHFARYGTIEGLLKVDPYLVNEWLVGLSMLEEASMEVGF
ncbi:MAG: hypothetical protein ACYTGC_08440 [Planctomycetota bacterium]